MISFSVVVARLHVTSFVWIILHVAFACRARVSVKLSRQFTCPEEAELHFKQKMKGGVCPVSKAADMVHCADEHKVPTTEKRMIGTQTEHGTSVVDEILSLLISMSEAEQLNTAD